MRSVISSTEADHAAEIGADADAGERGGAR
jgi:hypothetical protein